MSFASKNNKGQRTFDIDIEGYTFKSLKNIKNGDVFQMDGYYINTKGKYQDHPVIICKDLKMLIDAPVHMTETFKSFDDEDIEDIKAGKVACEVYTYDTDTRKDCKGIRFKDI